MRNSNIAPAVQDHAAQNALDMELSVSITEGGVRDTQPIIKRATLRELSGKVGKQRKTPNKLDCPMIKLGTFKGGVKADHIDTFSGVMGDYDAGEVQPDEAAKMLAAAGIGGVIYTTASHTDHAPRWRVLAALSEPTDATGMTEMTGRLNAALGGILGSESFRPALRFFAGVPVGSMEPKVITVDGKPVDKVSDLTPIFPKAAEVEPTERKRNGDPCPHDYETCLAALAALDPNKYLPDDRGQHYEWIRDVLWSFADATGGGTEAKADAMRWREGADGIDSHERQKFERIWKSDTDKAEGIGWATLFFHAREAGWSEWTGEDFDDLPLIDNEPKPDLGDLDDVLAYLLGTERPKPDPYAAKLEWAHEIQPVIESSYLLEDRLGLNGLSVCYGAPNAGKTFFLLQMALHLAQGKTFYGARCKPTAVLYLALEGGHMIANRVTALAREVGTPVPFALRRAGFNLLKPDGDVKEIVGLHRAMMKHVGDMPSFIVIDTLSRALAGGDENSPKDMTAFVKNVDAIRQETGAHVMIVHHCGKDEARGMRGHSSLLGAIDTELQIKAADTSGVRTAEFGKQRDYAEDHRPLGFTLRDVVLGVSDEGKEIRTAVADPAEVVPTPKKLKLSPAQQAALDILNAAGGRLTESEWIDLCAAGRLVSSSDNEKSRKDSARKTIAALDDKNQVHQSGDAWAIWNPLEFDDLD